MQVIQEPQGGLCYAKILVNDCFDSNELVLITINAESNLIEGEAQIFIVTPPPDPVVTTPPFMTTDTPTTQEATTDTFPTESGDGPDEPFTDPETTPPETTPPETTPPETTPPPVTTPPGPIVCNAQTATVRGICVPYQCGTVIQVSVTPGVGSTRPTVCEITQRSVVLQNFLFDGNVNQLLVDTSPLIIDDYNNPDLGFYADLTQETVAEARCNAGMGEDFLSQTIDLTSGPAATFSCLEE